MVVVVVVVICFFGFCEQKCEGCREMFAFGFAKRAALQFLGFPTRADFSYCVSTAIAT